MAKTLVSDVIVPEIFEQYVIERTAELPAFYQAGIVMADTQFNEKAAGGGKTVNMPFWQDISGARQILDDSTSLTTNKIAASKDVAAIHNDANAWSTNLMAKLLSGDDPMAAIGDLVAAYWGREDEDMLVASIQGLFKSLDAEATDPNILKLASESKAGTTDANRLTGTTFATTSPIPRARRASPRSRDGELWLTTICRLGQAPRTGRFTLPFCLVMVPSPKAPLR
jgi:hypothetical protein